MKTIQKKYEFVLDFWHSLRYLGVESFPVSDSRFTKGVEAMVTEFKKSPFGKELSEISVQLLYASNWDGQYHNFEEALADLRDPQSTYIREMNGGTRVFIDPPHPLMPTPKNLNLAMAFCEGSETKYDKQKVAQYLQK